MSLSYLASKPVYHSPINIVIFHKPEQHGLGYSSNISQMLGKVTFCRYILMHVHIHFVCVHIYYIIMFSFIIFHDKTADIFISKDCYLIANKYFR